MDELRWVLLALGVLLVAGVYLWSKGTFRTDRSSILQRRRRAEPRITDDEEQPDDEILFTPAVASLTPERQENHAEPNAASSAIEADAQTDRHADRKTASQAVPEKVVAIRFVPKDLEIDGAEAVAAMQEAGLRHGRFGIFHCHAPEASADDPLFSVASLTEPGSFDLERIAEKPLAGMSFFMVLPGPGDPVDRFDAMVETARSLAVRLDAELFDDAGSSWSIQRERYIREELISFRHQHALF